MLKVLYISNEDRTVGGSSLSLKAMLESLKGQVEPVILFRKEGPACALFRSEGWQCEVIPFRRATFHSKGLMRLLRFIPHWITTSRIQCRCVREAEKRFADVQLVHDNSGAVDIGIRIAKALGVPHVWHIREYLDLGVHTTPFPSWKHWKMELFSSDAVITISPGLHSHLGLENHKNGICIPDAVCSSEDSVIVPEKGKYVAFVAGSVSRIKRPDEAIRIFAAAGAEGHVLKIVGSIEEDYKSELLKLAEGLGVAKQLEFHPFTIDIKGLLSKAAAVLICTDFEGMGRVGVEAMFFGCPVIARNSGGSADIFADGRGYLYKDPGAGATALKTVLAAFPQETAENAQRYAIETFAIEYYGNKIIDVYNSVL